MVIYRNRVGCLANQGSSDDRLGSKVFVLLLWEARVMMYWTLVVPHDREAGRPHAMMWRNHVQFSAGGLLGSGSSAASSAWGVVPFSREGGHCYAKCSALFVLSSLVWLVAVMTSSALPITHTRQQNFHAGATVSNTSCIINAEMKLRAFYQLKLFNVDEPSQTASA